MSLKDEANRLADQSLPEQIRELRAAQAEAERLRGELRLERLKREQVEQELADAAAWRDAVAAVSEHETTYRLKPEKKARRGQSTAIICCNDWHTEQEVDARTVNGLNAFSLDVAEVRIKRLWAKSLYLLNFWRSVADVRNIVLWLGGDLVSGSIHPELEEINQLGPVDATSAVVSHLHAGITFLLEHGDIEHVHIVANGGNHGRTIAKPRHATAFQHSYETLAYLRLMDRCAGLPNITWQISRSYHAYLTLYDRWRVRFHHGQSIRYFGGVGGITIGANKAISAWNKSRHADVDVFGHWHQFADFWNWVSCGCLIGYDPYAIEIKADYQPPTQTFVVIDRDYGKVAALPIFVAEGNGNDQR